MVVFPTLIIILNGLDLIYTTIYFLQNICYNKLLKLKPDLIKKQTKEKAKLKNPKIEKYKNKTFVFTGFRDKDIESDLEIVNSKITTAVSKNTDYLIAANPDESSSKVKKAKELGVKVLSKEEFYKTLK